MSCLYRYIFGPLLVLAVIASETALAAEERVQIRFLDVGEGDSTLIVGPNGDTALIDAGNPKSGPSVVTALKELNVTEIDHLFLTHPHIDHMGGVFSLLPSIPVKQIADNGEPLEVAGKAEDIYRYYQELVRTERSSVVLKRGDEITVGDAKLSVLWPPAPAHSPDWNSNSLVLLLSFKKFKLLLMGDANQATERELTQRKGELAAAVIRVGHHGAGDASTREFLELVKPEVAIISVNQGNIRGYPAEQTLERLTARKINIYRTDKNGSITIFASKDGRYSIETER